MHFQYSLKMNENITMDYVIKLPFWIQQSSFNQIQYRYRNIYPQHTSF